MVTLKFNSPPIYTIFRRFVEEDCENGMPDPELLVKAMKQWWTWPDKNEVNSSIMWLDDEECENLEGSPIAQVKKNLEEVLMYTDSLVASGLYSIMEFFMIHKALRLCCLRAISWLIDNGEDTELRGIYDYPVTQMMERYLSRELEEVPNLYYGETHDSRFQCLKEHVLTMLRMGPLSRAVYNLETEKVLRMLMGEKRCFRVALGKDSEKNGVPECLKRLGPKRTIMSFLEPNIDVNDRGITGRGPTAVCVAQDNGYKALASYLRTRWCGKAYGYDDDEPCRGFHFYFYEEWTDVFDINVVLSYDRNKLMGINQPSLPWQYFTSDDRWKFYLKGLQWKRYFEKSKKEKEQKWGKFLFHSC
jgi:hypothetical protein